VEITKRIESLRASMADAGVQAYIITGSDPHGSENPPAFWRTREWISGFTGSAGLVVITPDAAGLWTDFRYWIQAAEELRGSGIRLHREGEDGVADPEAFLADRLDPGDVVAVDGRTMVLDASRRWESRLSDAGVDLRTDLDLVDGLWADRPGLIDGPVVELDEEESGESRRKRLERLDGALREAGADAWVGVQLDSVAWLLNVRGEDIPYNPVVVGYYVHTPGRRIWFTEPSRIPSSLADALSEDGVETAPYRDFADFVSRMDGGGTVLADGRTLSRSIVDAFPTNLKLRWAADPVAAMKACKNPVEIDRTRRAMEKDAVALVRFLMDLEGRMDSGEAISEIDAARLLSDCRAAIPGFLGESFSTIPGFGPNGAICHYEARSGTAAVLRSGAELFLIDSGGQWDEGTTDVTRTVALGSPSAQQRQDYTRVLKGHVALSRARFPRGTRGYQLDALARAPLWEHGLDYGHGTGHGVGYRLNVHEGPQRLSPKPIDVALEPGMIVSNEPGLYREGRYGIRIENLLVCRDDPSGEFGPFLAFDTLTLAPYDRRLIDTALLSDGEIRWIDAYHEDLRRRLEPLLEEAENHWLADRTKPLAAP